jgi:hypothetical protein
LEIEDGQGFMEKKVPLTKVFLPRERFSAGEHINGEAMLTRMKGFERVEKYKDDKALSERHPWELSEVERREELELIRRVIGLLERVVPERFPRVRGKKEVAGCT